MQKEINKEKKKELHSLLLTTTQENKSPERKVPRLAVLAPINHHDFNLRHYTARLRMSRTSKNVPGHKINVHVGNFHTLNICRKEQNQTNRTCKWECVPICSGKGDIQRRPTCPLLLLLAREKCIVGYQAASDECLMKHRNKGKNMDQVWCDP